MRSTKRGDERGGRSRGARPEFEPLGTSEMTRSDATSEAVALLAMVVEVGREPDGAPRAGTSAQYEELYRLHYSTVLGVCVRRLQGMADAEDAVQETFVRALAHPEVFIKPAPWLARVAIRVCIDELRRRQRGDLRFAATTSERGSRPNRRRHGRNLGRRSIARSSDSANGSRASGCHLRHAWWALARRGFASIGHQREHISSALEPGA